jgi:uncharacterized RDD family membrane protein YckC
MLCRRQVLPAATFRRRLVSLAYEFLLVVALSVATGSLFPGAAHPYPLSKLNHFAYQAWLIVILGCYFVFNWRTGGQTLAMKTWKIRLEHVSGRRLNYPNIVLRYLLGCISLFFVGAGHVWAYFDPDRQFLHDRIARTRIVAAL